MKLSKTYILGLLSMLIMSSTLVILLSLIPMYMKNDQGANREISVFSPTNKKGLLTEDGIVDYFSNYPLRCEITHIQWKQGALYLQIHKVSDEEELYKDIYLILKECFVERSNVKTVRFSIYSSKEPILFLDMKKEAIGSDPEMIREDYRESYKEYLQDLFKLNAVK